MSQSHRDLAVDTLPFCRLPTYLIAADAGILAASRDGYLCRAAYHSMANYEDRPTANEGLAAAHLPAVLLVEDAPGAWAHRRIELDDMRTRGVYLARGRCLCLPLGREAPPGLLRVRSIQDRQQDAGPAALATASSRSLA